MLGFFNGFGKGCIMVAILTLSSKDYARTMTYLITALVVGIIVDIYNIFKGKK